MSLVQFCGFAITSPLQMAVPMREFPMPWYGIPPDVHRAIIWFDIGCMYIYNNIAHWIGMVNSSHNWIC